MAFRILIGMIAAFAASVFQPTTLAGEKPNVLFIAIDDLNDWIGCLDGHPQALTPNLDALAQRGILFTNAHCTSPACNPSRAAVFSGRFPGQTGVWSNDSGRLSKLHPEMECLPHSFAKAGYATMGTGKMMHGGDLAELFGESFSTEQRWSPLDRNALRYTPQELPSKGSDHPAHVVVRPDGRKLTLPLNRMPSDRRPKQNGAESFDWGPMDVQDSEMGDTRITDWAIDRLGTDQDAPIFMGVGYYRPHIPLWVPKKYFQRFEQTDIVLPTIRSDDLADLSKTARRWAIEPVTAGSHATVLKFDQWRNAVAAYLACTTYVDAQVGRLLNAIRSHGLGRNTWIVVWTDHGWHLGEKQHWGKWTPWERSTRVPLIMVPPESQSNQFAVGKRCDQPVSLIDLYPTLGELCDVKVPGGLEGQSLVELLKKPSQSTRRTVTTIIDDGNVSLRNARHRYIRYSDGNEELYDLAMDPNEWTNIIEDGANDALVREMRKLVPRDAFDWDFETPWNTIDVRGWTVHLSTNLIADPERFGDVLLAITLLNRQLKEIVDVVPAPAVEKLRQVPLYFSSQYKGMRPRAEYHPGQRWLVANGRDPVMAKAVEFSNARTFEAETRRMPNFTLHELAHAYHDRVLGFRNEKVRLAFERARASGSYDWVLRQNQNRQLSLARAYALTNPQEYFAEISEAFFSENDWFPFVRSELESLDPNAVQMLKEVWGAE